MKTLYHILTQFIKLGAIPTVIAIVLGFVLWTCNSAKNSENLGINGSQIIRNVVRQQSEKGLLLPEVIFIGVDSSSKQHLDSSLVNEISELLTKRYLLGDTTPVANIN